MHLGSLLIPLSQTIYTIPLLYIPMALENMTNQPTMTQTMYWNNHTMLFKPVFNLVISPIIIVISILGIGGNSLVVWYLTFKIKRNTSTVYIFNLAFADASLLLFVTVLTFIAMVFTLAPGLEAHYEDVHFINVIDTLILACTFGYNTSLCLLTTISIERCLSVMFPIWYHCNRPKHLSSVVCTFIWVMSCLLSALEAAFCYNVTYNQTGLVDGSGTECKYVFIIICCFSFVIFIPSMTVSSVILLIKVCKSSQPRQYRKLYVVITVTVICFLVFGMPMRILLLAWYKHHIMPPFPIMDLFSLFCSINSAVNPFVYFLVGRRGTHGGKRTVLAIFQAVFRDEGSQYKREQRKISAEPETVM